MLELHQITKQYQSGSQRVTAASDCSLQVAAGELVAIQGASGSGKSTLLLMAGGLLVPDSGSVSIQSQSVYEMPVNVRAAFRAQHVGFVFQQFHLVPYLNVRDNILSPALAHESTDARQHCDELLERFGLQQRQRHLPKQLSVGERQRTALARALLNRPQVLLADEPTGNLDTENANLVLNHLREFANGGGAVLLVTHDPEAAARADRVLVMTDGRLTIPAVSITP